tara:strand:+ start:61 stop:708 length:648 start_codon:yes stop_codon:yes gene_type:complete
MVNKEDGTMRASIALHHGDCMEALRGMADNAYDLAIVDPPYGIGRDGGETGKNWKLYESKEWDATAPDAEYFEQLARVSKNRIIWGANYFTAYLPSSMGWVYWDKGQKLTMSDGELAFSSFNRALRSFECNRCKIGENGGNIHPTQKPVALYKWLLSNYAKEGDRILDTHLGSGSIAIACWDAGYDLTGYELDKDYYDAACARLEQHKAQGQFDI